MARFLKVVTVALLVAAPAWMARRRAPAIRLTPAVERHGPNQQGRLGARLALIKVNGQGPFRFILDTGANRSVLSQALATRLVRAFRRRRSAFGRRRTAGHAGQHRITFFRRTSSLGAGILRSRRPHAGWRARAARRRRNGGRLLHVDFTKRCVEIFESAAQMPMKGWQSAPARMRFGSLLMVPGEIMGVHVNVLIDTGSDISLANQKFRDALRGVAARTIEYHNGHAFTFGRPIVLEAECLDTDPASWPHRRRRRERVYRRLSHLRFLGLAR